MHGERYRSARSGRVGWRFRYTDPIDGKRKRRVEFIDDQRKAEKAMHAFLDSREQVKIGLPDTANWQMSYRALVERFLEEAPITTDDRRGRLKKCLERNLLKVNVAADLGSPGKLTQRLRKVAKTHGDHYAACYVQKFTKQLTRWAAAEGILPQDPLANWQTLPFDRVRERRAFEPHELRAVLAAAVDLDSLLGHENPSALTFTTLLVTGNRPSAVLNAKILDFDSKRIHLPRGNGKKRNGLATVPPALAKILHSHAAGRSEKEPLLLSHEGDACNRNNMHKYFKRCATLAFVRLCWPQLDDVDAAAVQQLQLNVAYLIYHGKLRGKDGPPAKNPKKIAARKRVEALVTDIADQIRPEVERRLLGRDMYSLRKTHISWARRLANHDSVRLQVGRAPRDVDERHYVDLVDAHESSRAVWDVLAGARNLSGEVIEPAEDFPLLQHAAGAEALTSAAVMTARNPRQVGSNVATIGKTAELFENSPTKKPTQNVGVSRVVNGVPGGIRTSDLSLRRAKREAVQTEPHVTRFASDRTPEKLADPAPHSAPNGLQCGQIVSLPKSTLADLIRQAATTPEADLDRLLEKVVGRSEGAQ